MTQTRRLRPQRIRVVLAGVGLLGSAALVGTLLTSPAAAGPGGSTPTTVNKVGIASFRQAVAPLGRIGGVSVSGDAYGSAVAPVPGHPDQVYGLTDRGPNVDGPDGSKIEPYPDFVPAIGKFRLDAHGRAVLLQRIPLQAADGTPYNGQVNSTADTGETITDLDGNVLPGSPYGYDSEGLVALADGTFWVSDEYGPFITHFDRRGRATERLSPYDGSLPAELARRTPNKGMEGLTVTPDGRTLVGILQSALTQPGGKKATKVAVTRIVTVDLRTRKTHEYAYVLDDPDENGTAVSEISALSATTFVVDERDGDFGPGAYKKLYRIDTSQATDVGPATTAGRYDGSDGGVSLGGSTLEAVAGTGTAEEATAALTAAGVTPVTKSLYLDLGALVSAVLPDGSFYDHDKIEGLAVLDRGRKIILSNDSDFGLADSTGDAAPFGLVAKTAPTGRLDTGEFLVILRG